jgi:hypothetical protein
MSRFPDRGQNASTAHSCPISVATLGNVTEAFLSQAGGYAHRLLVRHGGFGVFVMALLATPLCAQTVAPSGGPGGRMGRPLPLAAPSALSSEQTGSYSSTLLPNLDLAQFPTTPVIEDEKCLPWAVSAIRGATVSVMRLAVPSRARGEFEKACGNFKKNRLADAERHVRNAIETFPNYVAAWVMLGQVLEARQRLEDADRACQHALSIDATYLPPYLCLAEISVLHQQWDVVLKLTGVAIGVNPFGDAYAYFFRAMAYYRIQNLAAAEKAALETAEIDRDHNEVRVYLLLGQIYEAEGNSDAAAVQIRHFLKLSTNRQESKVAKQFLTELEGQQVPQ